MIRAKWPNIPRPTSLITEKPPRKVLLDGEPTIRFLGARLKVAEFLKAPRLPLLNTMADRVSPRNALIVRGPREVELGGKLTLLWRKPGQGEFNSIMVKILEGLELNEFDRRVFLLLPDSYLQESKLPVASVERKALNGIGVD